MVAPFILYSLSLFLPAKHGGVNRMGHVTAGALLPKLIHKDINVKTYGLLYSA